VDRACSTRTAAVSEIRLPEAMAAGCAAPIRPDSPLLRAPARRPGGEPRKSRWTSVHTFACRRRVLDPAASTARRAVTTSGAPRTTVARHLLRQLSAEPHNAVSPRPALALLFRSEFRCRLLPALSTQLRRQDRTELSLAGKG